VRLPWQPREYARTCGQCGYTWRVPRSAGRRRVGSISGFQVARGGGGVDRGELAREVGSISAENQAVEALRHCPECGADQFTQQAAHGDPSA
jgi:ribosomal protein S27AE